MWVLGVCFDGRRLFCLISVILDSLAGVKRLLLMSLFNRGLRCHRRKTPRSQWCLKTTAVYTTEGEHRGCDKPLLSQPQRSNTRMIRTDANTALLSNSLPESFIRCPSLLVRNPLDAREWIANYSWGMTKHSPQSCLSLTQNSNSTKARSSVRACSRSALASARPCMPHRSHTHQE